MVALHRRGSPVTQTLYFLLSNMEQKERELIVIYEKADVCVCVPDVQIFT